MRRVNILGIQVYNCDLKGAAEALHLFIEERPTSMHHVCTVNPEFVMEARHNSAFRRLLNNVELATPDGVGIIAAARLLGTPLKGRATGVGIVEWLASMSDARGYRLFFLGAAPGVADKAAAILRERHPHIQVVGTYSGSPDESEWPAIRQRLDDTKPDVLLVAYGAPKQDLWIGKYRAQFPHSISVAMGVGGVFDYISGIVPLAPPAVRRLGFEWLYRLIKQPWRWRRIARVFLFGALTVGQAISLVIHRRGSM